MLHQFIRFLYNHLISIVAVPPTSPHYSLPQAYPQIGMSIFYPCLLSITSSILCSCNYSILYHSPINRPTLLPSESLRPSVRREDTGPAPTPPKVPPAPQSPPPEPLSPMPTEKRGPIFPSKSSKSNTSKSSKSNAISPKTWSK